MIDVRDIAQRRALRPRSTLAHVKRHAGRPQARPRGPLLLAALTSITLVACASGSGAVQFARASATPTPQASASPSAALPDRPQSVLAGGNAVAAYLGNPAAQRAQCLPELVARWRLAPIEGARCISADLDGDRQADYAFVATEAPDGPGGDVWFFRQDGSQWRLTTSVRVLANQPLEHVRIAAAQDLTGDGLPDPVIVGEVCAANVCTTRVVIASGHLGTLTNLTPSELADGVPTIERVEVRDTNGDGIADLVLTANTVPSGATPGASGTAGGAANSTGSPPRRTEWAITWSGVRFFARRTDEPAQYRIHAMLDADHLADEHQDRDAARAYLAATAPTLREWSTGGGAAELVPYAYFRASVLSQRAGDAAEAARLLHTAGAVSPASLMGRAAAAYEAALVRNASAAEACGAAEGVLRPAAAQWAQAWAFGSAIPPRSIDAFCR